KYMAARGYGAEVVFHGSSFDDACAHAGLLARQKGLYFIPPFDDEFVMAGQGTVGLEIIEAVPDVDAIVVPIGGGGLIAGMATAVKALKRGVKVIGVESEASTSCIESLKAGRPVETAGQATIADGIAVKRVGDKTFPIIKELVDDVVSVGEETIAGAILKLLERKKIVVEGAGAVTLAAAMEGKLPKAARKVVFVLSGGNIDVTTLDRVIRAGLVKEGRMLKISTVLQDAPGSLAGLTGEIAAAKANILHVIHLREAEYLPVGLTRIEVILEVEGHEHSNRVLKALRDRGYTAS
ncbi:MAG: pyridoxal-phosphate dependent enzyme, partial [Deltaproteobacteria bacterium]